MTRQNLDEKLGVLKNYLTIVYVKRQLKKEKKKENSKSYC